MFTPRTLSQIHQEILQTLLEQNTQLTDQAPGSGLYTITRSDAAMHLQQELALLSLSQTQFLSTATEANLDQRAADYGITRKPGAAATGSVLVLSQGDSFILDPKTILTEPISGQQYSINQPDSVSITAFTETKIAVQSTVLGERGNLFAGTRLITPAAPQGSFFVGTHRTTAGEICGDISGGRNVETDEQLRFRLISELLNRRGTTESAIKALMLAQPSVPWAAVLSPEPGGFIQVWVDNPLVLEAAELTRLEQIANLNKPAGTLLKVYQAERKLTDINLYIKAAQSKDLHELTKELIDVTQKVLVNLQLAEPLRRDSLLRQVILNPAVLEARVLLPTVDVVPSANQVVRSSKVWVTYDTI